MRTNSTNTQREFLKIQTRQSPTGLWQLCHRFEGGSLKPEGLGDGPDRAPKTWRSTGLVAVGVLLSVLVVVSGQSPAAANVATYPAPPGESLSTDYEVNVAGQKVDVYTARVLDPPFAGKEWDYGGLYSFAGFDFSGSVTIRIVSKRSLASVVIRPESFGIKPTPVDDHTLDLTLDHPRKFSVEPDGKKGPLLLFTNPLETDAPQPGDKDVIYFGPGVHKPEKITLQSNQTLYLAGGAVVKAEVLAQGQNIRIRGRGILDGSDWEWRKGPIGNLIAIRNSADAEHNVRDVTFENVSITGSKLTGESGPVQIGGHTQNVSFAAN